MQASSARLELRVGIETFVSALDARYGARCHPARAKADERLFGNQHVVSLLLPIKSRSRGERRVFEDEYASGSTCESLVLYTSLSALQSLPPPD